MLRDAPGLPGGSSRWLLETSNRTVKMPPPCAVESHVPCCPLQGYAVSSKREPPRAKPVASKEVSSDLFCSNHRETPPDKPVVSKSFHTTSVSAGSISTPRRRVAQIDPAATAIASVTCLTIQQWRRRR